MKKSGKWWTVYMKIWTCSWNSQMIQMKFSWWSAVWSKYRRSKFRQSTILWSFMNMSKIRLFITNWSHCAMKLWKIRLSILWIIICRIKCSVSYRKRQKKQPEVLFQACLIIAVCRGESWIKQPGWLHLCMNVTIHLFRISSIHHCYISTGWIQTGQSHITSICFTLEKGRKMISVILRQQLILMQHVRKCCCQNQKIW